MADKYLRSAAAGAGTGADWTNAYTALATALAGMAAGDRLWVADDHAESLASSQTYTSPGTAANPCQIICVNHSVASGFVSADLRTTGQVKTTVANNMTFAGFAYVYGVIFRAGTSSGAPAIQWNQAASGWFLDGCEVGFGSTGGGNINMGSSTQANSTTAKHTWKNTKLRFGATTCKIRLACCSFEMYGGGAASFDPLASTPTFPNSLFDEQGTQLPGFHYIHDIVLFSANNIDFLAFTRPHRVVCERAQTVFDALSSATQPSGGAGILDFMQCANNDNATAMARVSWAGTQYADVAWFLNGGPNDGVDTFSIFIQTGSNTNPLSPFEAQPFHEFYAGPTGGAITVTCETLTDNVTLTNADLWLEVSFLGDSAGYINGRIASSGQADPLAAAANLATSSATWTAPTIGTAVTQKMSVTFTPQQNGHYRAVVKCGKASAAVNVSPPYTRAA